MSSCLRIFQSRSALMIVSRNHVTPGHALGCDDWFTARVTTCGELDAALATTKQGGRAAYIEVITDPYEAPALPNKLHDSVKTLYNMA